MGKKPYYRPTAFMGFFVAIAIGIIGAIGIYVVQAIIVFILLAYLYFTYFNKSESKEKKQIVEPANSNSSQFNKVEDENKPIKNEFITQNFKHQSYNIDNLEKPNELNDNDFKWWNNLDDYWKKIFNHYADEKQIFKNDKGLRPIHYTSFFYPAPDSQSIQNLSTEIPKKDVLDKQILSRKDLNLQLCYYDNFNLSPLKKLVKLEYLILPLFYSLNNADIEIIQSLNNLKFLNLNVKPNCDIRPLGKLKNLKVLSISCDENTINLNHIDQLRKDIPNCKIET